MNDFTEDFDFTQGPYTGLSTPRNDFPALLTYGDACADMWSLPENRLYLGVDGEGSPMTVDLSADSPHVLVSAASGAGKSVTARSIATQARIKGHTVVILDAKRHSHRWAKSLPGVHYASSIPEIANALISVAAELHRRNEIVEEWPGSVETAPVGPRILVIFEEINATMDALAALDKQLAKDKETTADAFGHIMFLGRAAQVNVLAIMQSPDRKIMRTAILENFGVRVLIAHSWETWSSLVPRASSRGGQPPTPTAMGRGYVVVKGKPREAQLLFMEEELCAELCRTMAPTPEATSRRKLRRQERQAVAATQRATGRAV
jgi:nucleotide-binding universal stress UspA family protein